MKKLITILIAFLLIGCNEQKNKQSDEYTLYYDTTDYTTTSFYTLDGIVSGINTSMFQSGDTIILNEDIPGTFRVKRPEEKIEEYYYLGRIIKTNNEYHNKSEKVSDTHISKFKPLIRWRLDREFRKAVDKQFYYSGKQLDASIAEDYEGVRIYFDSVQIAHAKVDSIYQLLNIKK
ncbi:hypothetical protein KAR91_25630 [Candidatus Pacearchaeota archaeon]|nr:hypothetical protein [Candidatus Pacearchaeota archaeon]